MLLVVGGYIAWTLLGGRLDAEQARLHPLLAGQVILSDLASAAPPGEWHFPVQSVIVWIVWAYGLWSTGAMLIQPLKSRAAPMSAAVEATLAFCAAFTLFGFLQFALACFGFATFSLINVFLLTGVIARAASPRVRESSRRLPGRVAAWWREDRGARTVLIMLAVAVAILLVPALTPPAQSDGMRYHLGAPQEFLKAGSAGYLSHNAYSNMPFLVEMHFMAALAMGAPEAAHLMHMSLALMTALGIFALGGMMAGDDRRMGAVALVPALLYFCTPMAAIVATWPYTDHGISLLLVASCVVALLAVRQRENLYAWVVLGLCLGGLVGTKYTMGPVAVAVYGLALGMAWRSSGGLRKPVSAAAAAGTSALVIGGIWFVRNWVVIGNPVYPFATGIFPGGDWGPANDAFLHARAGAKGLGKGALALLQLPWNATFHWTRFEAHNPGAALMVALVGAVAGMAVYLRKPGARQTAAFVAIIAALSFLIWFFSYQGNRLLLPSMALGLALVPVGAYRTVRWVRVAFVSAGLATAVTGLLWAMQWSWVATPLTPRPLTYLVGGVDKKSFFYRSVSYGRAFDYLNSHVRPGEKVLLVGEHRIYGANFQAVWSDWFDTPALVGLLREYQITSAKKLIQSLEKLGIYWILINEAELKPQLERDFRPWFTAGEWAVFEELRTLEDPSVQVMNLPPGVTIIHLRGPQP